VLKGIIAIAVGAVLGVVGARILFVGSWLSLVPWTIAGLLLGVWCERREWLWVGALYGFFLTFIFMVAGYSGSASVLSRLPFFALIGVFGAACGLALALVGSLGRRLTRRERRDA
jgi:hypothetical protein